ncbi:MAG: glutathione S-transferase family protein [Ramlibacter sp.]
MLKVWGRLSSINVRKVVLAAQWLGIPFERTDAGHEFGIVDTPDYLAKNPNAMVPLIEDGTFSLWESNVIVRYLCAKHSTGKLYPEALPARFEAERWMDWQQTTLNNAGRNAFIQLVRVPAERRKDELVAQSRAETDPLLDMLEAHLAKHAFMAGESVTMADFPIACEIHRWYSLPLARPARPHLDRWYQVILANPASHGVLDLPCL